MVHLRSEMKRVHEVEHNGLKTANSPPPPPLDHHLRADLLSLRTTWFPVCPADQRTQRRAPLPSTDRRGRTKTRTPWVNDWAVYPFRPVKRVHRVRQCALPVRKHCLPVLFTFASHVRSERCHRRSKAPLSGSARLPLRRVTVDASKVVSSSYEVAGQVLADGPW